MSVTYFGYNVDESAYSPSSNYIGGNAAAVWTCPNSGLQNVVELKARINVVSSSTYRIAIYDTDRNLIMQGSAAIAVTNTTLEWIGHTEFIDINGDPLTTPQLTGGTNYILVGGASEGVLYAAHGTGSAGDMGYKNVDYTTSGFPDILPAWDDTQALLYCIRCGVEPAAVAGPKPWGVQCSSVWGITVNA